MNKIKLCESCKTGKNAYKLDPRSPMCPYIFGCVNGRCSVYIKESKKESVQWH